jgi:hypothetical protein
MLATIQFRTLCLRVSSKNLKIKLARRIRWAEHIARMGDMRNAYKVSVRKPEGKRPPGRPRHEWENYIRMDLREIPLDASDSG